MPKATTPKPTVITDTPGNAQDQTSRSTLDVRIHSIRPEGNIRATASVNINGDFAIRNIKVMDGSKGLFISMQRLRTVVRLLKTQTAEYCERKHSLGYLLSYYERIS